MLAIVTSMIFSGTIFSSAEYLKGDDFNKGYVNVTDPTGMMPNASIEDGRLSPNMQIGDETWTDVKNTSDAPYKAIAYLAIKYKDGQESNATGFMITKKCMITAGHVFTYKFDHDNPAVSITAYFGVPYDTDSKNITGYLLKKTVTPSTATFYYDTTLTKSDPSRDYGAIIFSSELNVATFGVRYYNVDSGLLNKSILFAGYSRFDGNHIRMKKDTGIVDSILPTSFRHYADTQDGMSGGPVYESDNYAIGINVAESSDSSLQANFAYRFTKSFIDELTKLGYK